MPEPLIIASPGMVIPGEGEFWTSPEMYDPIKHSPAFKPHEVAKCFFGMSHRWLVKHLAQGYLWKGDVWAAPRTPFDHQYFRLWDIEVFAHILAEHKVLAPQRVEWTITVVKTVARLHQFIV